MKISNRLEEIFSHAVALEQSGRLRSTVYCVKKRVFIVNQDHTIMMRFSLRATDQMTFEHPVSFNANDYDSKQVEERDGQIVFIQENAGFERTKSCRTPDAAPREINKLFRKFNAESDNTVTLHSDILTLIDDTLSHIEFSCDDGQFKISQRNIYSGAVITLTPKQTKGLMARKASSGMADFEPIGLRTNDFMALFTFIDSIRFTFPEDEPYIIAESKDTRMPMKCIIARCVYDELGGLND
jgi:hypothetical protein